MMSQISFQENIRKSKVNFEFVASQRVKNSLSGIIIDSDGYSSGVHIGMGIDLSEFNDGDLRKMGLNPTLRGKLYPFLGRKGLNAKKYLDEHSLQLSESEVSAINLGFQARRLGKLIKRYDSESQVAFCELPECWQTVITSLECRYKNLFKHSPQLWRFLTEQQWESVISMLQSSEGAFATQHQHEADYVLASDDR